MKLTDMHDINCSQCKIQNQFYEEFNNDVKKMNYWGLISYVIATYESKGELSKIPHNYARFCLLQIINEWTFRNLKRERDLINDVNELQSNFLKKNETPCSEPEHDSNFIEIKKSNSLTESCPGGIDFQKLRPKKHPSKAKKVPKVPKVGTLKRKRYNQEKLKENKMYEDDLFEELKMKIIQVADDSNSEREEVSTPRWSVQISPRNPSRSPSYKDCYSPTEYQNIRKDAEEYQYRRNKRRKCKRSSDGASGSGKRMKQDPETYKTLKEVRTKLKKLEKKNCESDEDYYFTDGEDSNNEG